MAFKPENELEQSLVRAACDQNAHSQFYRDFLKAEIYLPQPPHEAGGAVRLEPGSTLQIQKVKYQGKSAIPVFSALSRLTLVFPKESSYLKLTVMDFLAITQGADFILNPGSECGKEFVREEILQLLENGRTMQAPQDDKAMQALIGQAKIYPQELVAALTQLFKTLKDVKVAYVAQFMNPATDSKPHTLVGIQTDGNFENIVSRSEMALRDVFVPEPPVDFMPLDDSELSAYFRKSCPPFYKKKFFNLFKT